MNPEIISGNYRIGIYVRESRDDNEENYETIETQRDLLVDFVKRNGIGEIIRVYMDDNASGAGFGREGIELLKQDVTSNKVNMLVLKDLSRLGRNNAKTLLFLDFLEEHGVRVITYDGRYDSLKDNDTVGIETWFNERYIRDISKKIRANLRFKIQRGEYIGKAPFGYKKSPEKKNSLCIDNETAQLVKEIFRMYNEGYGYRYIANRLNEAGYPTPSERQGLTGSKSWNAVAIRRILTNRVYAGDTVQGVSEKISFKSKKTRRLPPERWVVTENTHEPIISRDEFEKVQKLIEARSTKPHKGTLHMFKGILFCGRCGSIMHGRVRSNRPMGYICGNYGKNGKRACSSHYIREDELECILMEEILSIAENKEVIDRVTKMLENETSDRRNSLKSELARLEQLLNTKQRQQDILYFDKLEGRISEQLFQRTNRNLENRIEQLKSEIGRLRETITEEQDIKSAICNALEMLKTGGLTRELVRLFVKRIVVYEPEDNATGLMDKNIKEESIKKAGAVLIDFLF